MFFPGDFSLFFLVEYTVEKARKEFEEDLYEFYQYYNTIPDNELTERAKKIKEKLIHVFELEI